MRDQKGLNALLARLQKPIFDATYRPMLTVESPPAGEDILSASGNNYYENVALSDLENFDERYPLNSRVEKRGGKLFEDVWRAGTPDGKVPPGRYAAYIERIIANLERAEGIAEPSQADALRKLIHYYQTGRERGLARVLRRVGSGARHSGCDQWFHRNVHGRADEKRRVRIRREFR